MVVFGVLKLTGHILVAPHPRRALSYGFMLLGAWCVLPVMVPVTSALEEAWWVGGAIVIGVVLVGIMGCNWKHGAVTPIPVK